MWNSLVENLAENGTIRVNVVLDSNPTSFADALRYLRDDPEFRSFFIASLAGAPFKSFRWETPPITLKTANRPFEFVLVDSPELDVAADESAFARYFRDMTRSVVHFPNLGGDAILVVPSPVGPAKAYAHSGSFVRNAPESQIHELWTLVGEVALLRLSAKPVWISTAGAGVPWLHVRIDDRPKYYRHRPYCHETTAEAEGKT